MTSKWHEVSLDKVIVIKHGYAFPGANIRENPPGDILLTPGNFAIGGGFKGDKFKYFDGEIPAEYVLKEGDLLVTMTDLSKQADTLGYPALVPKAHQTRFLHNQRLGKVEINSSAELDKRFLFYLLRTDKYRHEVLASATGTTVKHTSPNRILAHKAVLPSLPEQKAIAHILGTLDDKIELNRRMNVTLEALARALFQSWFVDFDPVRAKLDGRKSAGIDEDTANLFPARFQDSSLGPIPQGWDVRTIEEVSERVAMGPFGSSIKVSTFVPEGIPVISGQHLRGTLLDDSEFNFVTKDHAEELKGANVLQGDVIFTHAGSIGQVAYIPETSKYQRYIISQRQFYIRCNAEKMSPYFIVLYFKTHEGQHRLLANTSSTGVPSISQPVTFLRQLKILVPPRELLRVFDGTIRSIHLKVAQNNLESRTLAALRDTLLPKSMSGEVRVAAMMERQRLLSNVTGTYKH